MLLSVALAKGLVHIGSITLYTLEGHGAEADGRQEESFCDTEV